MTLVQAQDSPRLAPAPGLSSLNGLRKTLDLDMKRADASVKLNKSMETWIARKSSEFQKKQEEKQREAKAGRRHMNMSARKSKIHGRRMEDDSCILSLEQAFIAHSAAFDLDGDGTICVEELILILDRCSLFDEFFTPNKVKNYFSTWADGCNEIHALMAPLTDGAIGFPEFKDVLSWGADIKGVDFTQCAQRVVRLSRKLCDKSSSVQRRLEVVFDAFCKKNPTMMSAFEFGGLCQRVGVYREDKFTMGDVYSLFYQISGIVHGDGVDFEGFISVVREVGYRLEIGEQVFEVFAKAVELLDTDEETVNRVKLRLKHAAQIVGGSDWRQFFQMQDPDKSGFIDWEEFLQMCRDKLHLNDRDSHLRILFDKLDADGSGELEIEELISFIES